MAPSGNSIKWGPFNLHDNTKLPALGLSTVDLTEESTMKAIDKALSAGCRCFETSVAYKNDVYVSNALTNLLPRYDLTREDIYIIRKLGQHETYSPYAVEVAYKNCVDNLSTPYLDLLLMPYPGTSNSSTNNFKIRCNKAWNKINCLLDNGELNAVGVCDFSASQLKNLIYDHHNGIPAVHQLNNLGYQDHDLWNACRKENIVMQALVPSLKYGETRYLSPEKVALVKIASELGVTPNQVLHVWSLQNEVAALVQSSDPEQIAECFDLQFRLNASQLTVMKNLAKNKRAAKYVVKHI